MRREVIFRATVAFGIIAGSVALILATVDAYQMAPETVGTEVLERLDESGVEHPVTAVLLSFRAYDTFLEIVVLTAAFWGVWSLRVRRSPPLSRRPDMLLQRISMFLIPVLLMIAVYLLWAGAHRPGGEFQAGAVLGAAGVLSLLIGRPVPGARRLVVRHLLVVVGAATFLAVAATGYVLADGVFGYPEGFEKSGMLVIESATAISIGFILVALFAGSVRRLAGDVELRGLGPGGFGPDAEIEYRTPEVGPRKLQSDPGDGQGGEDVD